VLAVGRAFFTVTALVAIYLDPTEPSRLATVTYVVLCAYALYSLIVLALVHFAIRLAPAHGVLLHAGDILWGSVLTFVSEGPVSPFFLFFLFVVLAAAYRWGFRETMTTAVVTVSIFLLETAIAAAGPWNRTWFNSIDFELNRTILRVAYLLLTGFLLGYLAEQDKQSRGELAAIAAASRQPRVDIGLGGSVTAVAEGLMHTFQAAGVAIVLQKHDSRKTMLWRLDRTKAGPPTEPGTLSLELNPAQRAEWLFPGPGRAWHAARSGTEGWQWRVTEPSAWRLRRTRADLPDAIEQARPFSTVTAIDAGLADEWNGRFYLFDMFAGGSLERRIHFLEALTDHITPGLTNVLLLRRLRSQAGATERARVARELHDGAIQALFGIELKVEALRRVATATGDVADELLEIQSLLRQEALALRELMQAIRPLEIDSGDQLADVLRGVVEKFRRDTSIPARFVSTGGPIDLHRTTALELVRIVQEALVNVRKHSRADNVLVRLARYDHSCEIIIEDDGCGFEFEGYLRAAELDQRRVGPAIIKERSRSIGAALAVDSKPGVGARIELVFLEEPRG
jgi:signal transduction histidine kinase